MAQAALARPTAPPWTASGWFALAGLAAMAGPTLVSLARQSWSTEAGAHGPIVLATGLWLLRRAWPDLTAAGTPGHSGMAAALFLAALPVYIFGRAYDFLVLEAGGLFAALCALALGRFGAAAMRRHWFAFLYPAFLIPPPGWAVAAITAPLKAFASAASAGLLHALGVPVYREGVTLYVAQYQLLVEDACAGMNSLVGLIAIGLFYVHVTRGAGWRHSLLLLVLIVPVALAANMARIMLLVLFTWYAGDAAARGMLHDGAGFLTFALALGLIFAADALIGRRSARAP